MFCIFRKNVLLKSALTCAAFSACFGNCSAAFEAEEDDRLLGEVIMDRLHSSGYNGNFSFFGDADFCSILIHQTADEETEAQNMTFRSNIYLKYLNTINGVAYGFQAGWKPQCNLLKKHEAICKTLYGFIQSDRLGEFQVGFIDTAASLMALDGFTFCPGFQGPGSGDFGDFYNPPAGAIVDTGVTVDDGKAAKIVWYSPVVRGFSLGASYTFNGQRYAPFKSKHAELSCEDDECWAHSKNVFTVCGAYERGDPEGFNAKFSVGGWFGQGKSGSHLQRVKNVCAYQIGTILGYKNFKLAFGYTDNGKSLISAKIATGESPPFDPDCDYEDADQRKHIGLKHGADAGKIYSVGALYNVGKLALCAGYFRSVVKFSNLKSERAVTNIMTFSAEYEVKKSIKIYAEYDNIISSTCDRAMVFKKTYKMPFTGSNKANVFMIGTKFEF